MSKSDLVARLRACRGVTVTTHPDLIALTNEAANRIEYLESVAGAVSQVPPESAEAYAAAVRKVNKAKEPRDA